MEYNTQYTAIQIGSTIQYTMSLIHKNLMDQSVPELSNRHFLSPEINSPVSRLLCQPNTRCMLLLNMTDNKC
jgi:hypothetical protein